MPGQANDPTKQVMCNLLWTPSPKTAENGITGPTWHMGTYRSNNKKCSPYIEQMQKKFIKL
jgi:hypothetical protein